MKPLAPMLGQGPAPSDAAEPMAKRPYRNLDVWPRARAALAAEGRPMFTGDIAKALGVQSKNVLMALNYHSDQVERLGSPGAYRWKLRSREAA